MTTATESLAAWAARVAPTLDATGWRQAEHDGQHPPRVASYRWTVPQARALLAQRDLVAAGLSSDERRVLADPSLPSTGQANARAFNALLALRLVRWIPATEGNGRAPTDFGREIARVLT